MLTCHRAMGTWSQKISRYIALTRFSKNLFVRGGLSADRIAVKPNFVADPGTGGGSAPARSGALFVGRLSEEKGIHTLLGAWSSLDVCLRIVGDGPLLGAVDDSRNGNLIGLGRQPPDDVAAEMIRACFLIFPSECYEGFPMTLAESFSHGLPVIASRLGAMAEIVEDGVTGLHFTPGDPEDRAAKVRWAAGHPEEMRRMGLAARRVYERKYTPEVNYRRLMTIYEQAIAENRMAADIPGAHR